VTGAAHLRPFFPGAADFAAAATPHFGFLVNELGFSRPQVSGEPGDGYDVRYDGASSAVLLSWESDGGFFGCQIIPLTADGTLESDFERWLSPNEVLAVRNALDEWPSQAEFDDIDAAGFGRLMARAARCLQEHCLDVLAGDWSVYSAAHRWLEGGDAT
jgi:hypothetical protein